MWSGCIPSFDYDISTWGEESTLVSSSETALISGELVGMGVGDDEPECIGILHANRIGIGIFFLPCQCSGSESQMSCKGGREYLHPHWIHPLQTIHDKLPKTVWKIIIENMKLRTSITSLQITDLCNQRWVVIWEAKELAQINMFWSLV